MANAAIELAKKEASSKIQAANRRAKSQRLEATLVRKGVGLSTAALYGTLNRMGVPIAIGGFPWKLGVGALATLAEGLTKGTTNSVMSGIADATMAIYIERSISKNTLIAGEGGEGSCGGSDDDDDGGEL